MRVLVMYRLMSGLQSVASERKWRPAGAPTAVKLIEALDKSDGGLDLVLYPADPGENLLNSGLIDVDGLSSKITVLDYGVIMKKMPRRVRLFLAPYWRAAWSLRQISRTTPDVFYTDRGNVVAASVVARRTPVKTVLRVLGVPPPMWTIFDGNRLTQILTRFSFRAPFSMVIGTRDGSGIAQFLKKSLGDKVPWILRVNGVDRNILPDARIKKTVRFVFLGRFEPLKGAEELLDTIVELPPSIKKHIHLTLIGHGSLAGKLQETVKFKGLDKQILFTGMIEHGEVQEHLRKGDIYISLNEQGQVSNANIEAAAAGLGMILSTTIAENDVHAEELWGDEIVTWVDRDDLKKNLQNAIVHLVKNPEEVLHKKNSARQNLNLFDDWDKRIAWEIKLLQSLADNNFNSTDWQANLNDK